MARFNVDHSPGGGANDTTLEITGKDGDSCLAAAERGLYYLSY